MNTYLVIVDGFGIGALADAAIFNSTEANTFEQVKMLCNLPNMKKLGLYGIFGVGEDNTNVIGAYARVRQISNICSFDIGYAEILGCIKYEHDLYSKKMDNNNNYNLINLLKDNEINVSYIQESDLESSSDSINYCNILRYKALAENGADAEINAVKLNDLDRIIGKIIDGMDSADILIIVGNSGVSLDGNALATREYTPIMMYLPKYGSGVDMGTIHGLDTVAMTIADYFGIYTGSKSKLSNLKILPPKQKSRLPIAPKKKV